jgi:hypothetical protein
VCVDVRKGLRESRGLVFFHANRGVCFAPVPFAPSKLDSGVGLKAPFCRLSNPLCEIK